MKLPVQSYFTVSLAKKEPGAGIIVSTVLCSYDVILWGWHNNNDTSCSHSLDLDERVFQLTCCSVQDLGLKEYAGVHVSNAGEEQPFGLNWPTRDYNLKNTWQRLEEHNWTITLAGGSFWISQFGQRRSAGGCLEVWDHTGMLPISEAFSWSQGHLMVFPVGQNWDLMPTVGQSWITTVKDRWAARQRSTFSPLTLTGTQWMWMWCLHIQIIAICNKVPVPVKIVPLGYWIYYNAVFNKEISLSSLLHKCRILTPVYKKTTNILILQFSL